MEKESFGERCKRISKKLELLSKPQGTKHLNRMKKKEIERKSI